MSRKDIITKDYVKDSSIFADVFNNAIYKGRQVIEPGKLRPLDTTVIGVPYGTEDAKVPVQKFRDAFKCLAAMADDSAAYLLLGIEAQSEIHYAMPVRAMVYDALGYAAQVAEAANSHRKTAKEKPLTSGEYLSGFYKKDRLIPIITLVLHFGAELWNGPVRLHEMLSVEEPEILEFVPDYRINLVSPAVMTEDEINRFHTSLREVMLFIKYSKDKKKIGELLHSDERYRTVEQNAARVIKTVMNVDLEVKDNEEVVDLCQAWEDMRKDAREEGRAEGCEDMAVRMLSKGKYSLEEISDITGLSMEKVKELSEREG